MTGPACRSGLRRPLRTAIVSSLNPTHQSAVVGASLRSQLVPALRLDARTPVADLVGELDRFGPRLLVAYASMVGPLVTAPSDATQRISADQMVTPCVSRKGSGSAAVYGSPTVALGG